MLLHLIYLLLQKMQSVLNLVKMCPGNHTYWCVRPPVQTVLFVMVHASKLFWHLYRAAGKFCRSHLKACSANIRTTCIWWCFNGQHWHSHFSYLVNGDQPNSWGKCAISRWLFEMCSVSQKIYREFEKFMEISQALMALISRCYITVN